MRPATPEDVARIVGRMPGAMRAIVFAGYCRARCPHTPSYPELARALGRRAHSAMHRAHQRWMELPKTKRQYWLDLLDGMIVGRNLEVIGCGMTARKSA